MMDCQSFNDFVIIVSADVLENKDVRLSAVTLSTESHVSAKILRFSMIAFHLVNRMTSFEMPMRNIDRNHGGFNKLIYMTHRVLLL